VKFPTHGAGLPGHAMASRMRAKEISFFIVSLDPLGSSTHWASRPIGPLDSTSKAGLAGHLPVKLQYLRYPKGLKGAYLIGNKPEHSLFISS